ncbi:leucine rich repeat containing protein 7 lap1 isoform X2 [Rhipicephalus microplus]|uniref:leucine rich repeat containing protein 7 lap1 isoform X2 n=1 Tax=Rhipicephalus microplus TaxID=6941 RepID=UPI001888A1A6|nr:protein scribble homolog isoform X2 [Rhipicephalus microplus]
MGMGPVFRHCPCLRPAREEVRVLDYAHHGLEDVPSEVFNYERTLEELYLNANQIKDLPRPLFHCHGLRKLNLSDNDIQTLPPALSSLISLEELDISKNNVIEIPDNIKGCKCLSIVEASVNPVGKLPEGFTQLLNIEQLYLNDTFLEYLPANFGRLSKLKILELRENHLKVLPKSMARLTELSRLDIGQNDFTELPEVIGSLPSMTELWCDSNRLTSLPSYMGNLIKLTYLDASRNRISFIADEIENMTMLCDLTLTTNKLQKIPETLGFLQNLTTLRLDDNHLATLPDSIGQLSKLEELIINSNEIDSLPSTIGLLRNLTILMADDNLLEDLPPEIGSCSKLRVLSLRDNRLCNVPDELGHLSSLRVVNLSGNQLRHLPVSLAKLGGLHALWLSQNQTKPLVLLQSDMDRETGQRVLTCFLLPQESSAAHPDKPNAAVKENDGTPSERRGTITFAFDTDVDRPGRLVRSPTPYPKELKARARHVRNLRRQMNGDVVGAGNVVVSQPTSRLEGFSRAEVPTPDKQPPEVVVREAKIVQPTSPSGNPPDLAQVHTDPPHEPCILRHQQDNNTVPTESFACHQPTQSSFATNNNLPMCTDLETVRAVASRSPSPVPHNSSHNLATPSHLYANQQTPAGLHAASAEHPYLHHQHHPPSPHLSSAVARAPQGSMPPVAAVHSMPAPQYSNTLHPHHANMPPTPHNPVPSWDHVRHQQQQQYSGDMAELPPGHAIASSPHRIPRRPIDKYPPSSRASLAEKFQHRLISEDSQEQLGYKSDQETYVQPTRPLSAAYHDGYSSDWDTMTLPRGHSISHPPDGSIQYFRGAPCSPGRTLPRRGSSPVSPRVMSRSPHKVAGSPVQTYTVQAPHPLKPVAGMADGTALYLLPEYCGDVRTSKEGYCLPVRRSPQPGWGPAEKLAPHAESEDLPPSQSSSSLSSSLCLPSEDPSSLTSEGVTPEGAPAPGAPCFRAAPEQCEQPAPPLPPRPRAHSGEGSATAPTPPPKPEFLLQRSVSSRSTDAQEHQNEIVLDKGSDADFVLENRPTSSGVFVKEVNPQGTAVGKLQVGDKILKVDDLDVSNAEVNYALGALVSAGSKVRLTLLRQQ